MKGNPSLRTAFRWFGPEDRVPLAWIRQMTPQPLVVTHLPQFLPGEVWTLEALEALRHSLEEYGLSLGPIESVFWSDAMKLGRPERDAHIENYIQTLKNLRTVFPEIPEIIVTYNLMPLDWSRTHLEFLHLNGARGLAFDQSVWEALDLSNGIFLPGWGKGYDKAAFDTLKGEYDALGTEGFWSNVGYALQAIVPAAAEAGVRLAAHPNDPPWSTLGLPALLCEATGIRRLLTLAPHRANALCFCTGSYGSDPANQLPAMIEEFHESIAWFHLRTVKTTGEKRFHETDHADPTANWNLFSLLGTIHNLNWSGIFRSDHGLSLFYETDLDMRGYPAIDRYAANKMLWAYWQGLEDANPNQ